MHLSFAITDADITRIESDTELVVRDPESQQTVADYRLMAYIQLVRRMCGVTVEQSRIRVLRARHVASAGEIVEHLHSRGIDRYSTAVPSLQLVRAINNARRRAA